MKSPNRLLTYILYCILLTYIPTLPGAVQVQSQRDELCKKLSKSPNFNLNYVSGKPWRFYYTWVVNMGNRCMEMKFLRVTRRLIDRIGVTMIDYMNEDINWYTATMMTSVLRIQTAKNENPRESLMFPEKGNPGGFRGVPNMAQNVGEFAKNSIPLTHQVFKLFNGGKFLVMADCNLGLAALMARPNQTLYRSEILAMAEEIWDADGYLICTDDKNKNEIEGSLAEFNESPQKNKMY